MIYIEIVYWLQAQKKGMDVSHAGYVFSFYALVMFLTAPIFGKIVSKKILDISGCRKQGCGAEAQNSAPETRGRQTFLIWRGQAWTRDN